MNSQPFAPLLPARSRPAVPTARAVRAALLLTTALAWGLSAHTTVGPRASGRGLEDGPAQRSAGNPAELPRLRRG